MTPANAKFLIAEDSESMRRCVCDVMKDLGVVFVDEAPHGRAAWDLFRRSAYDVVITDWNMPYLSGLELLRSIRGGATRASTPVVILSGEVSGLRANEAFAAGATGIVNKPFVMPGLPDQVLRILASLHEPAPAISH